LPSRGVPVAESKGLSIVAVLPPLLPALIVR